jgi:hypothetical protein
MVTRSDRLSFPNALGRRKRARLALTAAVGMSSIQIDQIGFVRHKAEGELAHGVSS